MTHIAANHRMTRVTLMLATAISLAATGHWVG